jgi:AraC family transcriptional regulator
MQKSLKSELSVGGLFGISNAPFLVTRPVRYADLAVTHLVCQLEPGATRVVRIPEQDCFFLMLYLEDTFHCDLTPDGGESAVRHYCKGSICLVDLADGASIKLHHTLHALAFIVPRDLLAEVSEFSKAPKARSLGCRRGEHDDVMWSLGRVLLPLFEQNEEAYKPVLGHVAVAICAHLLHQHGAGPTERREGAHLSMWQVKTAKAFMVDHFNENLDLDAISKVVGLSESRFCKEFEMATGQTPLEWLTHYRVIQAKHYFMEHDHGFEDIAVLSGFRDLAHFCDDFSKVTGFSPERWRNRWLN